MTRSRHVAPIQERIDALSAVATVTIASFLGALIVALDVLTGSEISFSVFYVIPIALTAWRLGASAATVASVVAAAAWFAVEVIGDRVYSQPLIPVWNGVVRFGFFAIISALLVGMRDSLDTRSDQALVDELTGLHNRRGFLERAAQELLRAERSRRALTIAYIDLDRFKALNDTAGHAAGDAVLQRVGGAMRSVLRQVDVVGRVGGDEFVVLLADTDGEQARLVVGRLHTELGQITDDSGVGFSIGVVTFDPPPTDVEMALQRADRLMYAVKQAGRGAVRYTTESGAGAR